jgi:hypothetical protein
MFWTFKFSFKVDICFFGMAIVWATFKRLGIFPRHLVTLLPCQLFQKFAAN